ncbi:hypothetical protein Tco_1089082 [Tanacetum coccineum]
MDEELAIRLHKEEKTELKRLQRERGAQEEASNAALIAEFDNVQARMEADALLAARHQEKERDFKEIQKLHEKDQKWVKDFIPMDSKEGGKKAASSKKRPRAEPDEESVTRPKIGEASGSEAYQIFADMLKKFNKDNLVKLWDLVKKRFSTTEHTDDKEKELWVKLKRLFEPNNDHILWKLQRYMHDPLVWRLYNTCGVHRVSLVRGHDIFMLVEKEYPLTRGTLGLMMVARLLVEAIERCLENF